MGISGDRRGMQALPPARVRPRRARGAAGRDPPQPRELRPGGASQPAHPHARAQRLGQEHRGRVHPARARALLDAGGGGALPLPLGVPQPQDGARRHRLRRRGQVQGVGGGQLRAPRRRSDRQPPGHRAARSPALPPPHPRAARPRPAPLRGRRRDVGPSRLADERQALPQEPAGLRGAPQLVQGLPRGDAAARAGGALLHLAAVPRRRGHHRPGALGRRRASGRSPPTARSPRCPPRSRPPPSSRPTASWSRPPAACSSSATC